MRSQEHCSTAFVKGMSDAGLKPVIVYHNLTNAELVEKVGTWPSRCVLATTVVAYVYLVDSDNSDAHMLVWLSLCGWVGGSF